MKKFIVLISAILFATGPALADEKQNQDTLQQQFSALAKRGNSYFTGETTFPTAYVLYSLGLEGLFDKQKNESFKGLTDTLVSTYISPSFKKTDENFSKKFTAHFLETKFESLKDRQVLSLGEGFSGFVPYLLSRGIHVIGLDLWYALNFPIETLSPSLREKELMKNYRSDSRFNANLISGNALDLKKSIKAKKKFAFIHKNGIKDNSFHYVYAHRLLGCFATEAEQMKAISEAIRVTKKSGQIRFTDFYSEIKITEDSLKDLEAKHNITVYIYYHSFVLITRNDVFKIKEETKGNQQFKDGKFYIPKITDGIPAKIMEQEILAQYKKKKPIIVFPSLASTDMLLIIEKK